MLMAYFNDMNFRDIHYKQKNIEKSTLDVVRQPIDNLYENITAHKEFMTGEENQVDPYILRHLWKISFKISLLRIREKYMGEYRKKECSVT